MGGQTQLFEVILAFHPIRRLANLLDRRQQQPNQDGDDGDDHQQLDERERLPS
jgi:hypothetical protein